MKKAILFLLILCTAKAHSSSVKIDHYEHVLNDVLERDTTKENIFASMERRLIKMGGSICSNRAHLWAYDFQRNHEISSAKIFLFYTKKTGEGTYTNWWYHVAPVVNEGSILYVMDAAFTKKPLTTDQWLSYFTGSDRCYEIKNDDSDLIEKMFHGRAFPETTFRGNHDCYYRIVPSGLWFPSHVAMNLLGKDRNGTPVHFERPEIVKSEVYEACVEAATSPVGRFLGGGKKKCTKYLED